MSINQSMILILIIYASKIGRCFLISFFSKMITNEKDVLIPRY
jgi:hypothetical protein